MNTQIPPLCIPMTTYTMSIMLIELVSLQWRHLKVVTSQIIGYNGLSKLATYKTSDVNITGHLSGESTGGPVDGCLMRKMFPCHVFWSWFWKTYRIEGLHWIVQNISDSGFAVNIIIRYWSWQIFVWWMPRDAYTSLETSPSLLQIMVCHLFGTKPLSVLIESVKTTSMDKESTVVLGKNKALFNTWK